MMKKIVLFCVTVALISVSGVMKAQQRKAATGISDRALSAQYKHRIEVLESEIKTVRLKLRVDETNVELQTDLAVKQAKVKELKSKKKVVDSAIKSRAASEKARERVRRAQEDAQEKAERHAADVQRIKDRKK
jgi:hypothetical protein